MKNKSRAILKQGIKYLLIIVVLLTGFFLYRIVWDQPMSVIYKGFLIGIAILIISIIMDALTVKDIIPVLRG
jgi:DNA integrity scanning protein DisA with diadenylate cyclase activity